MCIYCKYSSVADCTVCTVNVLCNRILNMTGTVTLCEQRSAAIYVHGVTVWGSLQKKATKMHLLVPSFHSVRLSSCQNWRIDECTLMIVDVSDLC